MELKRIQRYLRFCTIAGLAVFGLAASEHHGMVKFGSVPVPGATVTATMGDKRVVAVTDETGAYSFPDLADGTWKIQVEMLCFSTVSKEVGIAPNAPAAEWELKLLPMDEIKSSMQAPPPPSAPPAGAPAPATATGTPAPGAAAPAATQTATAATSKTPAKNSKNSKNGKNTTTAPASTGFQRTGVNASADGAAAAATTPSPGIASAASGSDSGVNAADSFVVNGSGSNGIERRAIGNARRGPGSLFNGGFSFQVDNSYLDARNYSLTGQDTPRAPFNHFQLSGRFGGPVLIPHVLRWNQASFFLGYQITRNRNANNTTAIMPTAAERSGDFSQVLNASGGPLSIIDPSNGSIFPGSVIPDNKISPQAKYLLSFYPMPQFAAFGQNYNYQQAIISRADSDAVQARINKTVNNKSGVTTQFTYVNSRNNNNNVFSFLDTTDVSNISGQVTYRRNFTRTFIGNFTANYSRSAIRTTPFFAFRKNVSGEAGILGNDQTPADYGPPSLSFTQSGIQGLSDGNQSENRNQTTAFGASFTYIRRPHNFQFGGDWKIQDFSQLSQQNGRGRFGFSGLATFDFAAFLLGIPDTSSLAFGNADKYLKTGMYDAFINDDWRVGPSFTLNWGVRWEYGSPVTELYGRLVNLDISQGFAASMPVTALAPVGPLTHSRYPDSLINPDKHAIQPRISFAWKPIFGASTTVRGGYGIYYNTAAYNQLANQMVQQSPLSTSLSVQNSPSNPLTLARGFVASPNITTNTFAIDPNFRVGFSQNWTVSVQQNVTASMVMTATYLGIKGMRQPQAFFPNTYPAGAVNPCPACLPGYEYLTSNGNSTKQSGQLSLRRRFHGGLSTNFSYTYSKAIDDANPGGNSWSIAQNWLDLAGERGLSTFDQRHLFTATFQYSTGVGLHGGALLSGWRGLIVKGWTWTANINAGTGLPFSPIYSSPTPNTGVSGPLRPEYLGGDIYAGTNGRALNAAAFGAPPAGQWGNAGRDILIGPNQFTMDGSMQRSFADRISVQFNAVNVLNHPNYSSWVANFSPVLPNGGSFGLGNPPGGMRVLKAVLQWSF